MKTSSVECISTPNALFELDVNCYVIPGEPLTLVDTGIGTDVAWRALVQGLAEMGLQIEEVQQVILTHKHADHFGLARRIQRASGARVLIHELDREDILQFAEDHAKGVSTILDRLQHWGTPVEALEECRPALQATKAMAESVDAEPLHEGQILAVNGQDLEVLHTPGHTLGSICLRHGNALMTGDHVLPRYTPNVGASECGSRGLLQKFLKSLQFLRSHCSEDLQVLPGHGPPIIRLAERLDFMVGHHQQRSARILEILAGERGLTTWQVAHQLFGALRGIHIFLGVGEVDAHFEYLKDQGKVRSSGGRLSLV